MQFATVCHWELSDSIIYWEVRNDFVFQLDEFLSKMDDPNYW